MLNRLLIGEHQKASTPSRPSCPRHPALLTVRAPTVACRSFPELSAPRDHRGVLGDGHCHQLSLQQTRDPLGRCALQPQQHSHSSLAAKVQSTVQEPLSAVAKRCGAGLWCLQRARTRDLSIFTTGTHEASRAPLKATREWPDYSRKHRRCSGGQCPHRSQARNRHGLRPRTPCVRGHMIAGALLRALPGHAMGADSPQWATTLSS